jgi:hypothetical protein
MNINDVGYYLESLGFVYDIYYEKAIGKANHLDCRYHFIDPYQNRKIIEIKIFNNQLYTYTDQRISLHKNGIICYDLDIINTSELLKIIDCLFDAHWGNESLEKYGSHRSNFELAIKSEERNYKINKIINDI